MGKGEVEAIFEYYCRVFGLPEHRRHYPFAPGRRLHLDFAWPAEKVKVGVEIQEETAHRFWHKQTQDWTKHNLTHELGWAVLYFSGAMLRDDPIGCIMRIKRLLEGKG